MNAMEKEDLEMNQDHNAITSSATVIEEITDELENLLNTTTQIDSDAAKEVVSVKQSTCQEEEIKTPPAAAATAAIIPRLEAVSLIPNIINQCNKDEYLVKTIDWKDKRIQIITQNENGPCPLVAICNVLFLRGDLEIRPSDRQLVTFEYLVERLGDYLLNHTPTEVMTQEAAAAAAAATAPPPPPPHELEKTQQQQQEEEEATSEFVLTYRHHLDTALSILPNLKSGLDVNIKFDHIHGFEPTAELAMFDLFEVDLVHGWIADPQDIETYDVIVNKCGGTYNHTVECIVQADEFNSTATTHDDDDDKALTMADEEKLHQAFIANEFLKDTATQLTYYGLDLLLDSIPVDTLCVLFRNNHFSTVYRHTESGLYMLVTDSGLVLERSIVWESLGDIDQGSSEFYDGNFNKPKKIHHPLTQQPSVVVNQDEQQDLDYAIAVSIQEEERKKQEQRNNNNNNNNGQSSNGSSSFARNNLLKTNKKVTAAASAATVKKKEDKCIIS